MNRRFTTLLHPRKLKASRYLSTWSPIAIAFNQKPPPFTDEHKGLFANRYLKSYQGFYDIRDQCIKDCDCLIEEATSDKRQRKMVEIFDELSNTLCKVADLAEFIRLAHPAAKYREAAENTSAAVSSVVEKLNTNRKLFDVLNHTVQTGDIVPTTETDNHVANLFLLDFKLSGIHLPELQRGKVVQLNSYLLQLGQQFVSESSRPRMIHKDKIPLYAQHIFPVEGNHVIVSGLNADSVIPEVRELAYRIYLHPDSEQEALLTELLRARQELAVTCGFKNYAEKALTGSIAQSPEMVTQFLDKLSVNLRPRAQKDFDLMHEMKQEEYANATNLAPWDVPYYTQWYKRVRFQVASVDYTPYFSLGACMDGLNTLLNSLYGISLVIEPIATGECWHENVYKLAVQHDTEGLLGYIYCDFFERTGKPQQDCHFTIKGGKSLATGYQLPIVVLMLNLPQRRFGSPVLLSPGMVDNLFHEMGHAMHSMLARTQYQHVTGTRCSTDFAEVPSILMEYFAGDAKVIRTFAKHFQTSEVIPDDMLQRLCTAKHIFTASEMQIQLFYSALDQCYHNGQLFDGNTSEMLAKVQAKYYNMPYVRDTAWQLRFSHLVGYGAKYYSYLFSNALASRIWHTYFINDPLSRTQGEYYRRECLAHGGGKPAWKLVSDFLQKEPTPDLLADALITDIDSKNDAIP